MKTVFCIDDNLRYLPLLKVAVRSLRATQGTDVACLCVYAGDKPEVLSALEAENIPVARYSPRLQPDSMPPLARNNIGCFLKLELALVPELALDEAVLYCDVDVLFRRPLDSLFDAPLPPYMGMVREHTAPFWHEHAKLFYQWRGHQYTVPLPFPIWTHSSGVVLFNLEKLRRHGLIDHFLAFSDQNVDKIGNLDQSLLNYFFGKRITLLPSHWNCPPYMLDSLDKGHIIHFHGPKPWHHKKPFLTDLQVNHFPTFRDVWLEYLNSQEREEIESWS